MDGQMDRKKTYEKMMECCMDRKIDEKQMDG